MMKNLKGKRIHFQYLLMKIETQTNCIFVCGWRQFLEFSDFPDNFEASDCWGSW